MVLEQNFFVEPLLPGAVLRGLTAEEMANYRAPFPDPASRKPTLVWPRQIPIGGEPADVVEIVTRYRDALCRSPLPKLLFTVEPGALVGAQLVAWCKQNLPSLEVILLGPGVHYVQEDHPDEVGRHLSDWLGRLARRAESRRRDRSRAVPARAPHGSHRHDRLAAVARRNEKGPASPSLPHGRGERI